MITSIKHSAIPRDLKPQTVMMWVIAREVYHEAGFDFVTTSLNDSVHSDNSYHYTGYAFDTRVRSRYHNSTNYPDPEQCRELVQIAASRLNDCFDIIFESDHIHWEYNAREHEK